MLQFLNKILFFTLIFSFQLFGESNSTSVDSKNFLWKVHGGKSELYILGSIHVGNKSLYPLNPLAEETFQKCDRLALEIEFSPENLLLMQSGMMKNSQYKAPKTIDEDFSKEEQEILASWMDKAMPKSLWGRMRPWMQFILISTMQAQAAGLSDFLGIDLYFYKKALAQKKKVLELESTQFQLDLIINLPQVKKLLLESCKYSEEKAKSEMMRLLNCVKAGDNDELIKVFQELKAMAPAMYKAMLTDRNIKMTEKVMEWMKHEKSTFVIMGAAHTIGEDGVITLLKSKGIKVERL